MDNISLLQDTKMNKDILRVAMEIAAKGDRSGNDEGIQDQIAVKPPTPQVQEEQVDLQEGINLSDEYTEAIADMIMENLKQLEESVGFELVDEELDFAINSLIEGLLSEKKRYTPSQVHARALGSLNVMGNIKDWGKSTYHMHNVKGLPPWSAGGSDHPPGTVADMDAIKRRRGAKMMNKAANKRARKEAGGDAVPSAMTDVVTPDGRDFLKPFDPSKGDSIRVDMGRNTGKVADRVTSSVIRHDKDNLHYPKGVSRRHTPTHATTDRKMSYYHERPKANEDVNEVVRPARTPWQPGFGGSEAPKSGKNIGISQRGAMKGRRIYPKDPGADYRTSSSPSLDKFNLTYDEAQRRGGFPPKQRPGIDRPMSRKESDDLISSAREIASRDAKEAGPPRPKPAPARPRKPEPRPVRQPLPKPRPMPGVMAPPHPRQPR